MFSNSKTKTVVGLDFEVGSVAATEVSVNGSVEVKRHGVVSLDPGIFREGEVSDPEALGDALKELFAEHKLARNVRLGIANQRVAVRTLRLPAIDDDGELETAIRFQAQDHIPMPLDQAVLDWRVVGYSEGPNGERNVDVVVVAARLDMLASVMEALRRGGLRPVGIDHSAFGMIRALAGGLHAPVGHAEYVVAPPSTPSYEERVTDAPTAETPTQPAAEASTEPAPQASDAAPAMVPATLYCSLGDITNLAVAQGEACLFTRISAFGVEGIAQKLAERRELTLEHAHQWLVHVGLEEPVERVEGEREDIEAARAVLDEGATKLADELRMSLEFYAAQEGAVGVETVVACGEGTTIPGLMERLQRDLGYPLQIGRPAPLAHLGDAAAARLTLSYGLALEK